MNLNKKEKNQQVQVFIRVRPLNKQEGNNNVIDIRGSKDLTIKHHATARHYMFDRVFGPESRQIDVYKLVAEPTVAEVIAGYNCTVLAYGQTGTGKTYTMAGGSSVDMNTSNVNTSWFEDMHAGIIPRTLAHMFDELRMQQLEYTVRVSYLELYNEEIFDLLSPVDDNSKLKLYDDSLKKGSVIVQGLTETTVNSKSEVYRILEKGAEKRRIASTLMNSQSSRSHTVFCITVHTKENSIDGEDLLKTGKLYLVDLAGSENIKQSGATDLRAREAFNINQSLLTLGRCIVKLTERSTHIPYRESKLTRLLQDSLGGRTKTTLIATVSPAFCNADETLNTLDYASRAKCITNKPEVNQRLSKKALLKEYTEEIDRLRKDLLASRMGKGVYLDKDNYDALLRDLEIQREEIVEKLGMIKVLQEDRDRKMETCEHLQICLESQKKEVEQKCATIQTLESQLEEASKEINNLSEETNIKQFIVDKHCETEQMLKVTAKKLINVVDITTSDTEKLHNKIDVIIDLNKQNKSCCDQQVGEFNKKVYKMREALSVFHSKEDSFHHTVLSSLDCLKEETEKHVQKTELISKYLDDIKKSAETGLDVSAGHFSEIREARNEYESEMKTAFAESAQTLAQKHPAQLLKSVDELLEDFKNFQAMAVILVEKCSKSIEDNKNAVDSFISKINSNVTTAARDARKLVNDQIQMVVETQKKLNVSMNRHREQQSMFNKKYKTAMAALEEMKQVSAEYFQTNTEQTDMCMTELTGRQDSLNQATGIIRTWNDESLVTVNNFNQFIETFVDTNMKVYMDMDKKMNATSQKMDEKVVALKDNLNHLETDAESAFKHIHAVYDRNHEKLRKQLDNAHDDNKTLLDSITVKIPEGEELIRQQKQAIYDLVDKHIKDISDAVAENEKECGDLCGRTNVALEECREGIKKLFTSSLKEYKQTGSTPVRKRYDYPKVIVETKPYDQLVEEYQMFQVSPEARETQLTQQDLTNLLNWEPGMATTRSCSDSNLHKPLEEYDGNRTEPIIERNGLKEKNKDHKRPHPGELITMDK